MSVALIASPEPDVLTADEERERPKDKVRCLRSSADTLVPVLSHSFWGGELGDVGEAGDVGETGDANCKSPSAP